MSGEVQTYAADPNGVMQLAVWSETALVLPSDLTYAAWEEIGRVLFRMDRSVQWWVGDWIRFGETRYGEKYTQAIEATGREYDTLAKYTYVAGRFGFFRRRKDLSFGHHSEVAALPSDQADRWLDAAAEQDMSVRDLRNAVKREKANALSQTGLVLPAGKYAVGLADPPWRYDYAPDNRVIENHYPTLDIEDIVDFRDAAGRSASDLFADDAVLYLWATNPLLKDALRVMEAWGFQYVTNMAWVKDRVGMGYWARQRHELVLIGTRGQFSAPPDHLRPDSVIEHPRREHSVKPPHVHDVIESVWPNVPKVELFGRAERPGWAVFGNDPAVAA